MGIRAIGVQQEGKATIECKQPGRRGGTRGWCIRAERLVPCAADPPARAEHLANTEITLKAALIQLPLTTYLFTFAFRVVIIVAVVFRSGLHGIQ